MVRLLTFLFSLIFAVSLWAQEDHSTRYVAHYAMETAKAKNFKDLAENLFPNPFERKEVLVFLKKHDLLKRSLPDVIAEGSQLIIKERKRNTILDLSQLPQMKFVFNNENLKFTGRESFLELYQKLTILHGKKQAGGRMQIFMSEAFADLPVLATVALAQYAKASMIAQMHDQSCPQNPSACETHAKNLQKEIPHLVIKSCKSQSGHLAFSTDEKFQGHVQTLQYNLELTPQEEPAYVSWIKVTTEKSRCEFTLGDGGFGTEYAAECFDGKSSAQLKKLNAVDAAVVTDKKFANLISCCSSDACSKFLVAPPARVQPLAGKKSEFSKTDLKK